MMRGFGTLISILALVLSGYTFWITQLQPSSLSVLTSPKTYWFIDSVNGSEGVWVTTVIGNKGAEPGVLVDLSLAVVNPGNEKKGFVAAYELNEESQDGWFRVGRPFFPVTLPGRQTRTLTHVFYPVEDQSSAQVLSEPGIYQFVFTGREVVNGQIRSLNKQEFQITVSEEDYLEFETQTDRGAGLFLYLYE
ncbi:MAG: hypothetical protein AAGI89_10385 [Pseudomonadota bacterium]